MDGSHDIFEHFAKIFQEAADRIFTASSLGVTDDAGTAEMLARHKKIFMDVRTYFVS